ncbi:MAG: HYExAFE family protein [Phycisphaerales bacterium]
MQRRHHYEQAFEQYLRARRVPYVAVDEARRALLPDSARLTVADADGSRAIKSFDMVLYGPTDNLLVEIKGRRIVPGRRGSPDRPTRATRSTLQSWVTLEDVQSLRTWEVLFGEGFVGAFLFVYWCDEQPPLPLFEEIFEFRGRWYAIRCITLREYEGAMRTRSQRWKTVHVPTAAFERASRPLFAHDGALFQPASAT